MRCFIFILIVVKSVLGDPDYADLGGHVLSEDIHLQHEIDAHYTNEIGEGIYGPPKKASQDPRKYVVDKDSSHGVRHLLKNYNDFQDALSRPENPMRDTVFMQHFHDVAGTNLRQAKSEPSNTSPSEETSKPADNNANPALETEDIAPAVDVTTLPVFDEHHMISPGGPMAQDVEPVNKAATDEASHDGHNDGHDDGHALDHDQNTAISHHESGLSDEKQKEGHNQDKQVIEYQPTEGDGQTNDIDETIGDDTKVELFEKDNISEAASPTGVPVNVHNTKPVFDEHHQINSADEGEDHSGASSQEDELSSDSNEETEEDQIMDDEGDDDDEGENNGRDGRIVNRSGQKRNRNRAGGATRIRSRPSAEDTFRPRPVYTEPVASGPIHSTHSHSEHHINHVEHTNIISTGSRQDAAMKIMSDVDQACYDPVTCAVKDTKVEVNILIQKDPVIREEITRKEAEEPKGNDTDDSDGLLAWLFG